MRRATAVTILTTAITISTREWKGLQMAERDIPLAIMYI